MYCRVTSYAGSPDRVDSGINTVREMLPRIKVLPGYAGFTLLVDRTSGESAAITYFKNAASLKASAAAAALVRKLGSDRIGGEVTSTIAYECGLLEVSREPKPGAWARVITGAGRRDKTDEVIATLLNEVLPALEQQRGFCASLAGTERKTGRGIMCSIFETQADLEASDQAVMGLRRQLQHFAEMADMAIHSFELVLCELPATALAAR
jgi:hypothetical protein